MLIVLVSVAALVPAACGDDDSDYVYEEPATVEEIGADLWRIELTEQAAARTGVETAMVASDTVGGEQMLVVPYSSVMYHFDGSTWAYTNPEPYVYVRAPIEIDHIDGESAILSAGPDEGTAVVSVGAAELYGVEFGVGK
ncbi:MAG: hypothetical protein OEW42_00040 [Acidimicrobiia bacterium]|nr:hypothetical protein [Acidimicrobiia bacterium]